MSIHRTILVVAGLCMVLVAQATAVSMDFVDISDIGNAGELSGLSSGGYGAWGPDRPNTGAVAYEYDIGKYEVTSSQYAEFLNAVAATDTYGLYNTEMAHKEYSGSGWYSDRGAHIDRSGVDGSYTYAVTHGWDNRPINWVSTGDVFRFLNWLNNGQPTGAQDLTTTEDGAYFLDGINDNASLLAVTRNPAAKYFLPTEDEWYKAAFYGGMSGYYDFAMQTDSVALVNNDILPVDPGFSANYKEAFTASNLTLVPHDGVAVGVSFPCASDVGEFENSASYYGTFDQSGNISEIVHGLWQTDPGGLNTDKLLARGGFPAVSDLYLTAGSRQQQVTLTQDWPHYGFRVSVYLLGDMNDDGVVDELDIDLMADAIRLGLTDVLYDISTDGTTDVKDSVVDANDLDFMVRFLAKTTMGYGTEYGDFNLDGLIDTTDLTRLATNFGTGSTWAQGNANRNLDLLIDTTDLTILATFYGFDASVDAIPEPATLSLLALGACLPLFRGTRR